MSQLGSRDVAKVIKIIMTRLIKFYCRFRNQYRVHHKFKMPLRDIIKFAWIQSGAKPTFVEPERVKWEEI